MARVREQLDREAAAFGITVVDVRIRRADLPEQNSQAVYQRMQTERQREAAEFRANGSQRKQEIQARADRDVTVLVADAQAQGRDDPRRGRGRAQPHLRRGLRQGPGLLRLLPLDAGLRDRAGAQDTRMVLRPDSDFFRYFADPSGKLRDDSRNRLSPPSRLRRGAVVRRLTGLLMSDFLVALGLVFVIEGLIFAASPGAAKKRHGPRAGDRRRAAARGRDRFGGRRRDPGVAGAGVSTRGIGVMTVSQGPVSAQFRLPSAAMTPLRPCPGGSTVARISILSGALTPMAGTFAPLVSLRRPALALVAAAAIASRSPRRRRPAAPTRSRTSPRR